MPTTNTGDRKITSNHNEIVLDDRYEALKAERDALAAQIEKLKYYIIKYQELGADFILSEALTKTPQQCLRDVQAEAGRAGFVECATRWNFCNAFGEFVSPEEIEAVANEYAATVRQGGAE